MMVATPTFGVSQVGCRDRDRQSRSVMVKRFWYGLSCCLLCVWLPVRAELCSIRYFQQDARYAYRTALLRLVLDKTQELGECRLSPQFTTVTQDRGLALMQEGRIDVVSMPTTLQRERDLRAVRFDVLRGLLGYRVLLIRKQQQADFAAVQSLAELRHFRMGFGMHWADLPLLQYNGFRVVAAPHYESLFAMLARGRFDGFPRGLNEAWQELGEQKATFPDLMVEPTLAFHYPWPVYFFVRKDNQALAERLQLGLQRAQADGSLRQLFMQHHGQLLQQAQLAQRRLFLLSNPSLPPGTPQADTSWWLPATQKLSGH